MSSSSARNGREQATEVPARGVEISVYAQEKIRRAVKNISQYAYERSPRTEEEAARSEKTTQKRNEHYEFIVSPQSKRYMPRKFEISCKMPSSCKLPLIMSAVESPARQIGTHA
jgi:hypothetical protein